MTHSVDLEQYIEESRLLNQAAASLPPMPCETAEDIVQMRAFLASPDSPLAAFAGQPVLPVSETSLPGPGGHIPARVIRRSRSKRSISTSTAAPG